MLNRIQLIGRLGQDPELRFTSSQKAVANLSIATTTISAGKEVTEWHRVVLWEKQAENCKKFLTKGKLCYIEGRLTVRSWDKDGQTHYTPEIIGSFFLALSPKEAQEQAQAPVHSLPQQSSHNFDFSNDDAPF